ncbi:MAG: hypothetical protein KAS40_12550, partial [Desulfobacterales bacterium]|nr:hypothetical protein [Desulfobacterales bacterium]
MSKANKILPELDNRHQFRVPVILKWFQNLRSGSRARRRPIEKAQHTWVCEHLSEACNAAIGP